MYWTYRSNVGTFWIKPDGRGRFTLGLNSDALGSYHSAYAAADDVYMCATGYFEWDRKLSVMEPTDLGEWQTH